MPSSSPAEKAILLLIAFSLVSSVHLLTTSGRLRPKLFGTDEITLNERRFVALKRELPQHGVVGYTGDRNREMGGIRDYYLTQYTLSPLVVDYSTSHHLVIGNMPEGNAAVPANRDLVLVADFGNGVRLYKNRAQ